MERLRRDQSQPRPGNRQVSSSSSLSPSVGVFDAGVGVVVYLGGLQDSRLGATDGPCIGVYTLFLVFILEHEKVRERSWRKLERDVIAE